MNQSSPDTSESAAIAFIQARWHADIVDQCRFAFLEEIETLTAGTVGVEVADVPGAFEIPLLAQNLARTGAYAAIVGAAFVVDGGIYRHEFVAQSVVSGLMQAQLETGVPIISAVLTPHVFQETEAHRSFFLEHFKLKGREAAQACHSVLGLRNGAPPVQEMILNRETPVHGLASEA